MRSLTRSEFPVEIESKLTLGAIRIFRPIAPEMHPQQIPCFHYVEISAEELSIKRSPVVSFEEFDSVKPRSDRCE